MDNIIFSHYSFLLDASIFICWIVSESEYQILLHNLSWLGPQCVDLDTWDMDEDDEVHMPRWRKTMNLSISCFITALIIIIAAIMLGTIGILYNQAACVLVDS